MSLRVQARSDVAMLESTKVWSNPQVTKVAVERDLQPGKEQNFKDEAVQADVESAVESINGAMEHISRGLRFSIHEDTQRVMVKVVDVATQEVIKEIPPEDVLNTAARIREMIGLLIDEQA